MLVSTSVCNEAGTTNIDTVDDLEVNSIPFNLIAPFDGVVDNRADFCC